MGAYILGEAYFWIFMVYCKTMQHCHQLEVYLPKRSSTLAISATLSVTPVILLQIVMLSPGTHLVKNRES